MGKKCCKNKIYIFFFMQNTISEISGVKYDLDIFPTDFLGVIQLACESMKNVCVRVCSSSKKSPACPVKATTQTRRHL